jgi:carbonic anhydrase
VFNVSKSNIKRLDEILSYNNQFVQGKKYEEYTTTKNPSKKLVILSCMDTRLTELLPKAMNIKNGDAKIIKNAGATIMHPFGSITRSIIVAIYEFGAEDVIVVGHHGCGMSNLDINSIMDKIIHRGVTKETISTLYNSGIDVGRWLHGFESVEESIKESVKSIKNHPLIPKDVNIHGLIIDPHTGSLEVVVNGYEEFR